MPMAFPVETPEEIEAPLTPVELLYGVKTVVALICALSAVYSRHRENAVANLSGTVVGALDLLALECANLASLNSPGPR